MQIIHRVSVASTLEIRTELASLGVVVAERGLVTFEIDEANEAWPKLNTWIRRRQALDVVTTKFLEKEIKAAAWLNLVPDWHHGYPQPDEDVFGYRQKTYDLTDYCDRCNIGMKQKAPFEMKGEPKWGRNGILQLNWVFDEYFVTPTVWSSVFKAMGIGCRPVVDTNGQELKTVVQLAIEDEVGIVTDGLTGGKCASCGRMRYLPITKGPFPALANEPMGTMVKTTEYFGSGAAAHKGVLICQELFQAFAAENIRGASVKPVESAIKDQSVPGR